MYYKRVYSIVILIVLTTLFYSEAYAQSKIPSEYRGNREAIARGVLDGNQIQTNFRNHGEMSRWNDVPWGVWPKGIGGRHIDGIGFVMAARVPGEREKWYGEGAKDTTLNPVIINYRTAGARVSPYSGNYWGWLPLNGFNNPFRQNPISNEVVPIPAISTDETSWPEFWPDRLSESLDSGWEGAWNGFRGKGLVTGHQETFYVMDDFSDYEYAVGPVGSEDVNGPLSSFGVYYPSPSDSTIGGLGLQTEVRTFQFNDVLAKDMLFTQYRTTNVSEKDIEETWTLILLDGGLGNEENDDNGEFFPELNLVMLWDEDGIGTPTSPGQSSYNLGYVGLLLLEHSIEETNGIDEDRDGMIDESKFNGPGKLIVGKSAIDLYLNENYDMETFEKNFQELSLFPAYERGIWWTGDEDLDWVAYDDFNGNGERDENEGLLHDLGRDGLGPAHNNYPGPDEGEADGIPTQGEPNFGEQDMMEAENRNANVFNFRTIPFYESFINLKDDTWLFTRIDSAGFEEGEYIERSVRDDEPFAMLGVGGYPLKKNTSTYFTTALIFGEDEEDLLLKAKRAQLIYESDYGQSALITGIEEILSEGVPNKVSLAQNYPNPFNPSTNIEFSLSKSVSVSLKIFDVTGREIVSLINQEKYSSGKHTIQFNAGDLASGIYFYQLTVDGQILTKKLTLIK